MTRALHTNLYSQSSWFQSSTKLRRVKSTAGSRILGTFSKMTVAALLMCALLSTLSTVVWMFKHSQCYSREAAVVWKEGAAHTMHRQCPAVPYMTKLSTKMMYTISRRKICLTTLSDGVMDPSRETTGTTSSKDQLRGGSGSGSGSLSSLWRRLIRCRNFDSVAKLTWPNHAEYARKQGYTIVDQSKLLDDSRPPAWSKIRAAQAMMEAPYNCEWVLWLDADTVIMDSSRILESLIPQQNNDDVNSIDLIVTVDRRFTANSGVWLMRNSVWSRTFLDDWWKMDSFVRPNGLSLSGDNDAFGHLVRQRLGLSDTETPSETQLNDVMPALKSPIRFIARCNMNSFGVFVPTTTTTTTTTDSNNSTRIEQEEWYLSDQWYHDGDFIAHASGIDQKAAGVQMLLLHAK